jgi:hypothetical protein
MIGETPRAADVGDTPSMRQPASTEVTADVAVDAESKGKPMPREIGGRDGPEPTRFGDWEKNGRCIDF